jgi:predicted kinase
MSTGAEDPRWSAAPAIRIPANALVILIGASASGKSFWARSCFRATEVVSSDECRALVADDEADQTVNPQAFAVFHAIIRGRLELGRLAVADSTALAFHARRGLRELAARCGAPVIAVVACTRLRDLLRNNQRRERRVPAEVLERHAVQLRQLVESGELEREGYDAVYYLRFPDLPRPTLLPPAPPVARAADQTARRESGAIPPAPAPVPAPPAPGRRHRWRGRRGFGS